MLLHLYSYWRAMNQVDKRNRGTDVINNTVNTFLVICETEEKKDSGTINVLFDPKSLKPVLIMFKHSGVPQRKDDS